MSGENLVMIGRCWNKFMFKFVYFNLTRLGNLQTQTLLFAYLWPHISKHVVKDYTHFSHVNTRMYVIIHSVHLIMVVASHVMHIKASNQLEWLIKGSVEILGWARPPTFLNLNLVMVVKIVWQVHILLLFTMAKCSSQEKSSFCMCMCSYNVHPHYPPTWYLQSAPIISNFGFWEISKFGVFKSTS